MENLKDIIDYRFIEAYPNVSIDELGKLSTEEIIMLSRRIYSLGGVTPLQDKVYNLMLEKPEFKQLEEIRYEEDTLNTKIEEIIKQIGLEELTSEFEMTDIMRDLVDKFPTNLSMMSTSEPEKFIQNFLLQYLNEATKYTVLTLKYDGWNVSSYYIPGEEEVYFAHTRGRDGAEFRDITEVMKHLLPKLTVTSPTKVTMELMVKNTELEYLKETYPSKNWITARSSISSILAGAIREEDYTKVLGYFAFSISDLSDHSLDPKEQRKYLEDNGFTIAEGGEIHVASVGKMGEAYQIIEDHYRNNVEKDWYCDGVVVTMVTDGIHHNTNVNFSEGLCAIKFGYFGSEILVGEIDELYYGENKASYSVKARLKPVVTSRGNTIKNMPLINLGVIAENWIKVGDKVELEYYSQQQVYFRKKISGADREIDKYKNFREERKRLLNSQN